MVAPVGFVVFRAKAIRSDGKSSVFYHSTYGSHTVKVRHTVHHSSYVCEMPYNVAYCCAFRSPSQIADNIKEISPEWSHVYLPRIARLFPAVLACIETMLEYILESILNGCEYRAKEFPARVGVFQWVVQAVGVAVEILAVVWLLNVVVGREETGQVGSPRKCAAPCPVCRAGSRWRWNRLHHQGATPRMFLLGCLPFRLAPEMALMTVPRRGTIACAASLCVVRCGLHAPP